MKICKKIKKTRTLNTTFYRDEETEYEHNINGPSLICYDDFNEISKFCYRIKGKYKNKRKGPIYFIKKVDGFFSQWRGTGCDCLKYYYNDFSIYKILTRTRDYNTIAKRIYKKGKYFDNIRSEIEIARQWI